MTAEQEGSDARRDEGAILRRMLADADRLCASGDTLVAGQCVQLRGRIAALVDIVEADLRRGGPS